MTFSFEENLNDLLTAFSENLELARETVHALCESPIEKRFADAILTCNTALECRIPVVIRPNEPFLEGPHFQIAPQRPIKNFRADFALVFGSSDERTTSRLVVECDGHDFHEKTKAQAARDKMRDRFLIAQGWPVMRFTGSEIHKDPSKCADEAAGYLFDEWAKLCIMLHRGQQ